MKDWVMMGNFLWIFTAFLGLLAARNGFKAKVYRGYWKSCAILLLGGVLLLFIGESFTTVDQNGMLHEVGLCLPIGAIMGSIGEIIMVILGVLWLCRRYK